MAKGHKLWLAQEAAERQSQHFPSNPLVAGSTLLHGYSVYGLMGPLEGNQAHIQAFHFSKWVPLAEFIFSRCPAPSSTRAGTQLVFHHLKLQINTKQTYIKITLRNNPNYQGKEIPSFFFILFFLIQMELFFGQSPGKQTAEISSQLGAVGFSEQ